MSLLSEALRRTIREALRQLKEELLEAIRDIIAEELDKRRHDPSV